MITQSYHNLVVSAKFVLDQFWNITKDYFKLIHCCMAAKIELKTNMLHLQNHLLYHEVTFVFNKHHGLFPCGKMQTKVGHFSYRSHNCLYMIRHQVWDMIMKGIKWSKFRIIFCEGMIREFRVVNNWIWIWELQIIVDSEWLICDLSSIAHCS